MLSVRLSLHIRWPKEFMHWCRRKIRQHFAQQARDTLQLHPSADRGDGGGEEGGEGRGERGGAGSYKGCKRLQMYVEIINFVI